MVRKESLGVATTVMMVALMFGGLTLTLSSPSSATTIYVATTGNDDTGDGSGENPYATIQKGINVASDGDTVRVAAGLYEETFEWRTRDRRLVGESGATLDGTLSLNHVVETARIEGLTFQGGSGTQGGALFAASSNLTIVGCTFTDNSASEGGAVWAKMSNFQISGCTFSGNSATGAGGALYLVDSSPTLTNNTFTGNSAGTGMVYALRGKPTLTGNTISGNTGVGVFFGENCLAVTSGNTISGNSGNGLSLDRAYSVSNGDTISGNTGDGVYTTGGIPVLVNAIISGNTGNGVNAFASYVTVADTTVTANGSTGVLSNNQFPTVANCVIYGNSADLVGAKATYSNIGTGETVGNGNITADPMFVGGGDYHIRRGSPCQDVGNNDAIPAGVTTDIDGDARIIGDAVDMGADEYKQPPHQPDLWIKQGVNWLGDDIYNVDGTGQTGTKTVVAGKTAVYYARLYNDGTKTETFWIKGPAGNDSWTVQYLRGSTDVTNQITSTRGWKRPNVPVGAMRAFTIKVTPKSSLPSGRSRSIVVRARSNRDPTQRDAIKIITQVK